MIETKLNNLEINELTQEQYESAKASGSLNSDAFYMTEANEEITVTPIAKGGTNAQTAQEARTNLGFEYGSEAPTHVPETGDGAIYFKIDDDDNGILSIEEGGTSAVTGHDALVNLGAVDYVVDQGISGLWTYRKWNSGIAECWLTTAQDIVGSTANGSLMGGYYAQLNSPPFGAMPISFVGYPISTCQARLGTGLGTCNVAISMNNDATTIAYITCWGNQASNNINGVQISIKGRWK